MHLEVCYSFRMMDLVGHNSIVSQGVFVWLTHTQAHKGPGVTMLGYCVLCLLQFLNPLVILLPMCET